VVSSARAIRATCSAPSFSALFNALAGFHEDRACRKLHDYWGAFLLLVSLSIFCSETDVCVR
jgi:hypothetical protein